MASSEDMASSDDGDSTGDYVPSPPPGVAAAAAAAAEQVRSPRRAALFDTQSQEFGSGEENEPGVANDVPLVNQGVRAQQVMMEYEAAGRRAERMRLDGEAADEVIRETTAQQAAAAQIIFGSDSSTSEEEGFDKEGAEALREEEAPWHATSGSRRRTR